MICKEITDITKDENGLYNMQKFNGTAFIESYNQTKHYPVQWKIEVDPIGRKSIIFLNIETQFQDNILTGVIYEKLSSLLKEGAFN